MAKSVKKLTAQELTGHWAEHLIEPLRPQPGVIARRLKREDTRPLSDPQIKLSWDRVVDLRGAIRTQNVDPREAFDACHVFVDYVLDRLDSVGYDVEAAAGSLPNAVKIAITTAVELADQIGLRDQPVGFDGWVENSYLRFQPYAAQSNGSSIAELSRYFVKALEFCSSIGDDAFQIALKAVQTCSTYYQPGASGIRKPMAVKCAEIIEAKRPEGLPPRIAERLIAYVQVYGYPQFDDDKAEIATCLERLQEQAERPASGRSGPASFAAARALRSRERHPKGDLNH